MKFIRKNGRIIPIREKGGKDKAGTSEYSKNTRKVITSGLTVTAASGYSSMLSNNFARLTSKSANLFALNAVRAKGPMRKKMADSAVMMAKVSMKASSVSSKLSKVAILSGLTSFGAAIGHKLAKDEKESRREGSVKGAAIGLGLAGAFFKRSSIKSALSSLIKKKKPISKIAGLLK